MTGEHKLALIISFAVVLLVGVLISDHLSDAQTPPRGQEPEHLPLVVQAPPLGGSPVPEAGRDAPAVPRPDAADGRGPLGDALSRTRPQTGPDGGPSTGRDTRPYTPHDAGLGRERSDPLVITQGTEVPVWEFDAPRFPELAPGAPGSEPESAADRASERAGWGEGTDSTFGRLFDRLREATGADRPPSSTPPSREVAVTPPTRAPAEPPARLHHVQKNESLYAIAKQYYGDGNLWRALAGHNADRVGTDGSVRAGVALRIPPADRLGVSPAGRDAERAPNRASPSAPTKPEAGPQPRQQPKQPQQAPQPGERRYVVKAGETLGLIAQRELGSTRRMADIMSLNPSIKDADDIRAGMSLALPKE